MAVSPLSPTALVTIAGTITPAAAWTSDYGPVGFYEFAAPEPPAIPAAATTVDWVFELVAFDGTRLVALPAWDRKVTLIRNQPGSASFSMPPDLALRFVEWLVVGEVDLLVRRAGVPILRGPLGIGGGQLSSGRVTFAAVGILQLLADRMIPAGREIAATEQAQMAWQIVSDAQLLPRGDLGITQGSLPDSVARTRTWDSATPVLTALGELADAEGGFDFEVTPTLVFNVHYPRQGVDHRLDPGGVRIETGRNVSDGRLSIDGGPGRIANEVTAVSTQQVSVVAEDVDSQLAYRLRQRTIQVGDIDDAPLMGDLARAEIRRNREPRPDLDLDLIAGAPDADLGRIGLGDVVPVNVQRGWLRAAGAYRVDQIEVTIPDVGGPEALKLTLTPEAAA